MFPLLHDQQKLVIEAVLNQLSPTFISDIFERQKWKTRNWPYFEQLELYFDSNGHDPWIFVIEQLPTVLLQMALVAGGQPDKPEDTTGGPHPHQLPVNTVTD